MTDSGRRSQFVGCATSLLLVIVLGCNRGSKDPAATPSSTSQSADPWTEAGFLSQPEMDSLRARVRPEDAVKPGTTVWTAVAERPEVTATTPGALLGELVHALGWDTPLGEGAWQMTLRVLPRESETAEGIVLQWNFQDDAVAGRDFRVFMRKRAGIWGIERIERRFHCRRGITADQRCQ